MNRLFLLLFGAVSLVAHAQVPDYVPTEGLVAWYPLDGDGQDIGPMGLHGTTIGTECGANRFDQSCGAVTFTDGDRIVIETDSTHSSAELTICFWTNLDNVQSYNHFLNRWEGSDYEFVLSSNNTGLYLYVGNTLFLSDHLPTLDEWHHLTFWYSSMSGSAGILEDGVSVAEFTGIPETPATNYPMHIGGVPTVGADYNSVNGEMDDLAIWNRILTEEEILALYNAELPVPGCTDSTACNFDAEATSDDGSCIPSGCMEPEACNYNALAECAGEACDYTCCPGPGCCLEGTVWDAELGGCIPMEVTCPEDLDFDGVVGVNDLMELLSAFGTDCPEPEEPETTEFTCGDPVNYHGYDYATVQIGEQCWFAENLRTELYQNGDSIQGELGDEEWAATAEGAYSIYGEGETSCSENSPDGDACDATWSYEVYGSLYNWYATIDNRNICPSGWHVPHEFQWTTLESYLEVDIAEKIKTPSGWQNANNGTNTSGFSALPNGWRGVLGYFTQAGGRGLWWTVNVHSSYQGRYVHLLANSESILHSYTSNHDGLAVRCLKD